MAGYKGHTVGGAILGFGYIGFLNVFTSVDLYGFQGKLLHGWYLPAALMVLSMLFALWPDVDTNSKGQDILYTALFGLDLLLIFASQFQAAAYLGILAMLPIVGKHRGWTHKKISMVLIPSPLFLVPYLENNNNLKIAALLYGSATIGYFSHLLLDGLIVRWFRIRSRSYLD